METGIIDYLADQGIASEARSEAPGVYVEDAKIASLGLRIRKGRSYHGLSLNVDMDLEPFKGINPCGYKGLRVTQLADLVQDRDQLMQKSAVQLANKLAARLGYRQIERESSSSGIV
jgi:lipoyl(octanoyl) transferase